jgi:hypothetical protein
MAVEHGMVPSSRKSLRQRGDALFPNLPYILKTLPLDRLWIVADPLLDASAMQREFVRANLLGNYCFLVQKPRNRLRGICARSCDVDTCSALGQIAMHLREGGEAIAREDYAHSGTIALAHIINAQGEYHR